MGKRYFWLKLKDDFFTQKEIKRLRKLAGGDTYTIIYLKLLLLSLKNEGKIYFDSVGDDFADELSLEIDEETDNIRMTLNYLQQKGLLELIGQDEIYLNEVKALIGSESDSVERVRKHRREIKTIQEEAKALGTIPYIENYQNNKFYDGNYYKSLQRDDLKCVSCGSAENLNMHHIIGNREDLKASRDKSSLITLCRKCHSREHANPHSIVTDELLEIIGFDFKLYKLIDEISNNTGNKKLGVTCNINETIGNTEIDIEKRDREEIEIDTYKEVAVTKEPKIKKIKYAEFVSMTEEEYSKLISEHGEPLVKRMIEVLDNYKGSSGKKYKSDYRTILNWVIERVKKEGNNGTNTSKSRCEDDGIGISL